MSNRSEEGDEGFTFRGMPKGIKCPKGTEITTEEECTEAFEYAEQLGIVLGRRKHLVSGSWSHVPSHCSYQAGGDKAFHFNARNTSKVRNFENGMYQMICKTGNVGNAYYDFILLVLIERVRIYNSSNICRISRILILNMLLYCRQ